MRFTAIAALLLSTMVARAEPVDSAKAVPAEPVVLVSDAAALAELPDLGSILDGTRAADNEALAAQPRWHSVVAVLDADLAAAKRADAKAGVGISGHDHRLFDGRWLRARTAHFELIGVVNRPDRIPFTPGGCGETRLIYRLAYQLPDGRSSRLPMTVNVDFDVPDDGDRCRAAAQRWRLSAEGTTLGRALRAENGPLAPARLAPTRLRLVQINLQLVRWPSAVRPDLGGHAEYLLRAFRPEGDHLAKRPLDNSPDIPRLKKDRRLRTELLGWLADERNLARIDDGTAILPERFCTDRAVSVAPRGLARRANRPFRQLFNPADLTGLSLGPSRRTIGSPEALLRRLDDATCVGCHQGRTIAGFHFLGVDAPTALPANALAVPMSPHLVEELGRRRHIAELLAEGKPVDLFRPFSERTDAGPGGWGARCGRGDAGFAAWRCAPGLECTAGDAPVDDAAVGSCFPARPDRGAPCAVGPIRPNADGQRDHIDRARPVACAGDAYCEANAVGFPGGMCSSGCAELEDGATCGTIAILSGFNDCLARRQPFERCLAENVRPAGLRACDRGHPCRDDYVCVRSGNSLDAGACIPPYFLFQLRVDGHP